MILEPDVYDALAFINSNKPSNASRVSYVKGDVDSPSFTLDFVSDDEYLLHCQESDSDTSKSVSMDDLFSQLVSDMDNFLDSKVGILLLSSCGCFDVSFYFDSPTQHVVYDIYFDICTK